VDLSFPRACSRQTFCFPCTLPQKAQHSPSDPPS
jgi:hypothetical protein